MPASRRRRALTRSRFTGENKDFLASVLTRADHHEFDHCSVVQRAFRAELAMLLLNTDIHSNNPWCADLARRRVWTAWPYIDRFLPFYDRLVIISSEPKQVRKAFWESMDQPSEGIPGFGWKADADGHAVFMDRDGAMVHICAPDTDLRPFFVENFYRSNPLKADQERLSLLTPDAEQLAASLLMRLPLAHPDGRWTLDKLGLGALDQCTFHGGANVWRLSSTAASEQIGLALIDPDIGLEDASIPCEQGRWKQAIRYDTALLWMT